MYSCVESEIIFGSVTNCIVIAEIGVNHDGDLEKAKALAKLAHQSGAELVKFQAFIASEEISQFAEMAEYQKTNMGSEVSQLQMAEKLELSFDDHIALAQFCDENKIPRLYSVFEEKSFDFLLSEFDIKVIKVPSGEITNTPLLEKIARSGVDVLLSTGCSFEEEVDSAINLLRANFKFPTKQKLMLFQCVSEYPTPPESSNLSVMGHFRAKYDLPVGLSDHSDGIKVATFSAAAGAKVIEKHFTSDKDASGPDHAASINQGELIELCSNLKYVRAIMGDGVKRPEECEMKNRQLIRKSIVAKKELKVGHVLIHEDLGFKRPADGIPPSQHSNLIGKKLLKEKRTDEPIFFSDVD